MSLPSTASVLYVSIGGSLSIHVTLAVELPVNPFSSSYSNVNSPFFVNVYSARELLFSIVTFGLLNVIVALTSLLVKFSVEYAI